MQVRHFRPLEMGAEGVRRGGEGGGGGGEGGGGGGEGGGEGWGGEGRRGEGREGRREQCQHSIVFSFFSESEREGRRGKKRLTLNNSVAVTAKHHEFLLTLQPVVVAADHKQLATLTGNPAHIHHGGRILHDHALSMDYTSACDGSRTDGCEERQLGGWGGGEGGDNVRVGRVGRG